MSDTTENSTADAVGTSVGSAASSQAPETGSPLVKRGLADMLKGGVIMDVVTPEQARIAEDAGAVAVMALERVPADIRAQGGVARMSDPDLIAGIIEAVSIPVMAKARIGHFVEAQVLQELRVDFIDESEVLSPADYVHHINKHPFTVPFVCGATNLGEALRRVSEGAAMIRSKGEAGTGDVSEATRHIRAITKEIAALRGLGEDELYVAAKELGASYELVRGVAERGALPVVLFTAGGVATPAGPPPSCGPRPATTTPPWSYGPRALWARPWSASTSPTCRRPTAWRSGAGESRHPRAPGRRRRARPSCRCAGP